jgi:hypothetical protein
MPVDKLAGGIVRWNMEREHEPGTQEESEPRSYEPLMEIRQRADLYFTATAKRLRRRWWRQLIAAEVWSPSNKNKSPRLAGPRGEVESFSRSC